MSEKISNRREKGVRVSVLVPIIFATVAFILTLLATISGSKPGMLENAHSLTLNTSGVGSNLVEFSVAANSSSSGSSDDGSIGGFLSGLLNNITAGISSGLNSVEGDVIGELTSGLGLADFYSFHLLTICQGSFSSDSDPDATLNVQTCNSYHDAGAGLENITKSIPSSTTIAGTNVSIPILSTVSNAASYLNNMASTLSKTSFAFFILTMIGLGLSVPLSVLAGLRALSPLFHYGSLFLWMATLTFQTIGAVLSTGLILAARSTVNQFGGSVGLSLKLGTTFLTFVWVSFTLILLGTWFWMAIWFVDFREISYKARRRTPDEVGNWKGIGREILTDLRQPKRTEAERGWATQLENTSPPYSQSRQRNSYN